MKSLKYSIYIIVLFVCACQAPSQKASETNSNENLMFLCNADTVAVESLVNQFLDHYKNEKYADAVAMLYNHSIEHAEPEQLDNDQIQEMISALRKLPILRYEVNSLEFHDAENNLVKCTLYLKDNTSIGMRFSPTRYLGQWRLCLKEI